MNQSDTEYDAFRQLCQRNIGTIVRIPEYDHERLLLSKTRRPDRHQILLEAAFWERDGRPPGSSKYKTYTRKSLSGMSGRSVINDGGYADTREEAIEWIEDTSAEFDGERLNWGRFPVKIVGADEFGGTDD
jgi:hypothetical protein